VEHRLDGQNGGLNGGRSCWVVAGTLCEGKVQGTFANKLSSCSTRDFFLQVAREERPNEASTKDLLDLLKQE
jgi:hypothetical protein